MRSERVGLSEEERAKRRKRIIAAIKAGATRRLLQQVYRAHTPEVRRILAEEGLEHVIAKVGTRY